MMMVTQGFVSGDELWGSDTSSDEVDASLMRQISSYQNEKSACIKI